MDGRETHTEIEVADFGPIAHGKVALRPLTVFVGPGNAGKSYLATLIYALHRHFGAGRRGEFDRARIFAGSDNGTREYPARGDLAALDEAAKSAAACAGGGAAEIVPPAPIVQAVRREIEHDARFLDAAIARCLGLDDAAALIRKGAKNGARIALRRPARNGRPEIEHELTLGAGQSEYRLRGLDDMPISVGAAADAVRAALHPAPGAEDEFPALSRRAAHALGESALPRLAAPCHVPAYYIPAGRGGAMHARLAIVSALVRGAAVSGNRSEARRTPLLTGVLADFLEQMLSLDRSGTSMRKRNRRDWGAEIEESMLGGRIEMEPGEFAGFPYFFYRPAHWKGRRTLPLANASSAVSELAPVVLYLRYLVDPGDVLIVEEPEAHLHPAMQAEFMRRLTGCVRSGIRIIMTTHSEWLTEELANAVMRSEIPEERRKDMPNGDAALRPDQVGVYLFQPRRRPRGSVVSEIGPDERGLYSTGFDRVAKDLYNGWNDISRLIGNET